MTDIKTEPLKQWLKSRNASLHAFLLGDDVYVTIATRTRISSVSGEPVGDRELGEYEGIVITTDRPPMAQSASPNLDEAVRLAQLQYDIERIGK